MTRVAVFQECPDALGKRLRMLMTPLLLLKHTHIHDDSITGHPDLMHSRVWFIFSVTLLPLHLNSPACPVFGCPLHFSSDYSHFKAFIHLVSHGQSHLRYHISIFSIDEWTLWGKVTVKVIKKRCATGLLLESRVVRPPPQVQGCFKRQVKRG